MDQIETILSNAVEAAALVWVKNKNRETSLDDIQYFKSNWESLPGLRFLVEREIGRSFLHNVCKDSTISSPDRDKDGILHLNPCPFCGGAAKMLSLGPVVCTQCGVRGVESPIPVRLDRYEELAAKAWNRRPGALPLRAYPNPKEVGRSETVKEFLEKQIPLDPDMSDSIFANLEELYDDKG